MTSTRGIDCRYFDGRSSRAWPATIAVDGEALRVAVDGVDRTIERRSLTCSPAIGGGPARVAFGDGSLCEIDDRVAAASLFARLGHREGIADRLASRTGRVLAVTAAFVAVMAALYQWGIPWIADAIVDRAPASWDHALGDGILETLDRRQVFRPSALPAPVRDRIARRFDALSWPADGAQRQLVFRKLGVPNALALPGGVIVLTDEIVELAGGDDDAIATVLAHEVGHVAHRDVLRQLTRSTITSALAAWYLGDVSNAAAVAAGSIGTLSYSRAAEHRADLYAVDVMRTNGRSTRGAAELFRRLEAWQPPRKADDGAKPDRPAKAPHDRSQVPEYLATHPDTDDRIRLFDNGDTRDRDAR